MKENGDLLFLAYDYHHGQSGEAIRSSVPLADIFPADFSPASFMKEGEKAGPTEYSQFIMRLQLPRTGTETVVRLFPLPLGMRQKDHPGLRFATDERAAAPATATPGEYKDLRYIKEFIRNADKAAHLAMNRGAFAAVTAEQLAESLSLAPSEAPPIPGTAMPETFVSDCEYAYAVYTAYTKLAYRALLLEWDEETGRFTAKDRGEHLPPMTFVTFLLSMEYWEPD